MKRSIHLNRICSRIINWKPFKVPRDIYDRIKHLTVGEADMMMFKAVSRSLDIFDCFAKRSLGIENAANRILGIKENDKTKED